MATKKKDILITGGAGCIGLEVCKQLVEKGIRVRLLDLGEQIARVRTAIPKNAAVFYGSILDASSLREAMKDCSYVVHLAALLGVKRTEENRLRCLEINIEGTKNVLDTAVQSGIQKFIFASSSEVYGEPLKNPVTEESMTQGKSVYAISKLAGEELCKGYAQRFPGFIPVILRLFNTYGPSQAAQFVVPRFILNAVQKKPLVINGDGKQVRSYCFVEDIARGIVLALLKKQANHQIINLGNGKNPLTLTDLAKCVQKLTDLKVVTIRYRKNFEKADRRAEREVKKRFCSGAKAKRLLGFEPRIDLEAGIRRVIQSQSIFEKWESAESPYIIDEMT